MSTIHPSQRLSTTATAVCVRSAVINVIDCGDGQQHASRDRARGRDARTSRAGRRGRRRHPETGTSARRPRRSSRSSSLPFAPRAVRPPEQPRDDAERDRREPGEEPVDEHCSGHLVLRWVGEARADRGGQAQLDDAEPAGCHGNGRQQSHERERGEHLRPSSPRRLRHADVPQRQEQHEEQRQVAEHRGRGDPQRPTAQQADRVARGTASRATTSRSGRGRCSESSSPAERCAAQACRPRRRAVRCAAAEPNTTTADEEHQHPDDRGDRQRRLRPRRWRRAIRAR